MIPAQREAIILEILRSKGVVKVEDLADELNVTPMTIRRDLTKLESQNLAYRSHGGATLRNPLQKEQLYDIKKMNNHEQKQKIAQAAYQLVNDGDAIFLDIGTTTYELAVLLKQKKDITVVTNDLKIALELYQSDIRVFIAGGEIQKETAGALGTETEAFISNIRVDIAFVGTSSISSDWNICTPTFEKATLKKKIMACTSQCVLLADSSKFGKEAFVKICSLEKFNVLVTDRHFSKDEQIVLSKMNIDVINVT
ncbi:DeoR/GlpR family DNA-binding transcription regulator [Petroclostridium sp. X23]|uniref:DeoR/GlpR family DNA-binding transcription regulator n=1 Tax=Petroclostridium sp. X23 TaxID=3045146 RepID=UPI0024AD8ABC|nr:DeoR/GlpR family DNA-binding transcription regulator [Petroclostridium sp. X23]WHH61566.1 DeoR/GlpR family DNA-binding transcription regulator [Petroclostridium sp. X23]